MKKFILFMLLCLCVTSAALAWEMESTTNYVTFPELDEMKGYFRKGSEWTIVHQGNWEEHLDLLLARGGTEEEIRQRFEAETLLWEAYNTGFQPDACIRMERFVNEWSREVWHLRHLSTAERKALLQTLSDGDLLPEYDTYSAAFKGNGGTAYMECGFTNYPPAVHESGKMQIRVINGQAYVMTYAVYERMAGQSKLRTKRENELISGYSPFNTLSFGVKLQPQLPDFELDEAFPYQVELGEVKITGKVTKGASMAVTMDGKSIPCKVDGKGKFNFTLNLKEPGDYDVSLTVSHKKHTTRVETFTVNASDDRTPLTLTAQPEEAALAGEQTVAGLSEPGAEIRLWLDEQDPIILIAGLDGSFAYTFDVPDAESHWLSVTASAIGKDDCTVDIPFYTEYETVKEGIDAFEKNLTTYTVSQLAQDPQNHLGERVKISVKVKEVTFTPEGLGVLCQYNPPKGSKHDKTPLYLTLYGYGQDQIQPDMTLTVYATVRGQKELQGETRLELLVQYGTYLVMK